MEVRVGRYGGVLGKELVFKGLLGGESAMRIEFQQLLQQVEHLTLVLDVWSAFFDEEHYRVLN